MRIQGASHRRRQLPLEIFEKQFHVLLAGFLVHTVSTPARDFSASGRRRHRDVEESPGFIGSPYPSAALDAGGGRF